METFGQLLGIIFLGLVHLLLVPLAITVFTFFMIPFSTAWIGWVGLMTVIFIIGRASKK